MELLERPQRANKPRAEVLPPEDEEDEVMQSGTESEEEEEKDETEVELERLIFGDSAGFRDGLKGSELAVREDESDEEADVDGLDDADVGQALKAHLPRCIVC